MLFTGGPNHQFVESGGWIVLAGERAVRQQRHQDLGGGPQGAAVAQVPAEHTTRCIGHRHVQVCTGRAQRAGQAHDLQRPGERHVVGSVGVPKAGLHKAADAGHHKGGVGAVAGRERFQSAPQIGSGGESKRDEQHEVAEVRLVGWSMSAGEQ